MKKRILIVVPIILLILFISLVILFNIEIKKENEIVYFSFSEELGRFDEITCYDDGISYDKKLNVSITGVDFKKILFFYKITLEYENGNLCDYEYVLEEDYITNFIANAKIKYNTNNIDIEKLIEGKTAIVGNIRYLGNDYENSIEYILDGKHEILFVFNVENLLVIQVGYPDEGPKYIAYK